MKTHSICVLVVVACAITIGCRHDMQDQPKYKPLGQNRFWADGRDSRPIPAGTIAVDELNADDPTHTGQANGAFLDTIPLPVNMSLLERGRDRFDIFCSPCHGWLGDGNGMVARRGLRAPANLMDQRSRELPPGYVYQVISNGYGAMGDYADQIQDVRDRWAIVAYIKALQLSRGAPLSDVPDDQRAELTGSSTMGGRQ
ncbi:MAG: cytochrome c [Acidobacteriaceae bacterium]|nr:cytochrome c [Acidobacteriaceae bacterium]MBV8571374.1 cytochrome c [Acidobacteriaceae bacterium]